MNKKSIVYFGFALTAIIGFQSCKTPEGVPQEKPVEGLAGKPDIAVREVVSGYLTGYGEEGIKEGGMVINSESEWNALTTKMNSVNESIKEQSFDFGETTVLVYFDKVQGSGGFEVDIASVVKDGKNFIAKVRKTIPTGDVIEIMTQPFVISTIEKTSQEISFKVL